MDGTARHAAAATDLSQRHRVLPADVIKHAVPSPRLDGEQAGAVRTVRTVVTQHQGVPNGLRLLPAHLGQIEPQVIDAVVRIGLVHQIEGMQLLPAVGPLHQHLVSPQRHVGIRLQVLNFTRKILHGHRHRLCREDGIAVVVEHLHIVGGHQGGKVGQAILPH